MTTEEKQLLLKDLCSRLSYGVKFQFHQVDIIREETLNEICLPLNVVNTCYPIDKIKLYLRPMSSMTEEELFNYKQLDLLNYQNDGFEMPNFHSIDWLNAHHFDYRGLIEKGLALEAPEGMYKDE